MSFRPGRFTEADVRRARKAAPDCTVEITTDGTIRIVPTRPKLDPPIQYIPDAVLARKRDVRF
jgi:hypothetical protein